MAPGAGRHCLALNGQEWYQRRFGAEGRLGLGWRLWSVGGRFVTLVLLAAAILGGLTGVGKRYGEPPFGFGYEPTASPSRRPTTSATRRSRAGS